MLSVVTWKWTPAKGYRSTFGPETVNVLRRMVRRHYPRPHRFVCVTDDPRGIDPDIEIVPLWNDFATVPSPWGPRNPSCYRRLRAFAPGIEAVFGDRFVSLDLDLVIVADVTPLWDRPEPFVVWGDVNPLARYNCSMFLLRAGSRPQVWTRFDPRRSPALAKAARQFGSDQGWISYVLGPGEPMWTARDGVYSYRNAIAPKRGQPLPPNARMVMFHGVHDPWSPQTQAMAPWIREHYR